MAGSGKVVQRIHRQHFGNQRPPLIYALTLSTNLESWHMATNKNGSTLAALNAQIAALQAQADALRKTEMAEVIAKVKDAIAHYGLTVADLGFGRAVGKVGKSSATVSGKPARKGRKRAVAKPPAKAVKFKDDQGHTWGGIGKRPDWFKAALAAGKTPEDLLAKG